MSSFKLFVKAEDGNPQAEAAAVEPPVNEPVTDAPPLPEVAPTPGMPPEAPAETAPEEDPIKKVERALLGAISLEEKDRGLNRDSKATVESGALND